MGLYTTALLKVLQTICDSNTHNKSLCMIGKQAILIQWESFMKTVALMNLPYDKTVYNKIKNIYPIDSYLFFKMFGLKDVHAIDYSTIDGADIIFDLNMDLPDELKNKFDYIINGGTLEHVFDVAKAMKNISEMLCIGGRVIHLLPVGGYVDHGFYSFSPTFFLDFYKLNGYCIHELFLEFMYGEDNSDRDEDYGVLKAYYSQDCRLFMQDWRHKELNNYIKAMSKVEEIGHIYLWCIAQRKMEKHSEYPIQGYYQQIESERKDIKRGVI